MKRLFIGVCLLSVAVGAMAQSSLSENRRKEFEKQKVAFFNEVLELTPDEAALFWPLYYKMHKQERGLDRKVWKMREELERDSLAGDEAYTEAIRKMLAIESRQLEIRKETYREMLGSIPACKIWKLSVAEQRFRRMLLNRLKKSRNVKNK